MPTRAWIPLLSVWPGLAQVWAGQEVLGLILASVFGGSLTCAVTARWIWIDVMPPAWSTFLAILAAATWVTTLAYTAWWVWRCHPDHHRSVMDRLYREAMELYLLGKWGESIDRCEDILSRDEFDADALMHLGLCHLRSNRVAEARQAFRQCLHAETGAKWRWEIGRVLQGIPS